MLVLYIKIYFTQRHILFFPRNKVTVVLKLALIASHIAETLIENLPKTSECDVIFAKQRPQTLHVALFNLCYLLHTIMQRNLHQIPMIISDM